MQLVAGQNSSRVCWNQFALNELRRGLSATRISNYLFCFSPYFTERERERKELLARALLLRGPPEKSIGSRAGQLCVPDASRAREQPPPAS